MRNWAESINQSINRRFESGVQFVQSINQSTVPRLEFQSAQSINQSIDRLKIVFLSSLCTERRQLLFFIILSINFNEDKDVKVHPFW